MQLTQDERGTPILKLTLHIPLLSKTLVCGCTWSWTVIPSLTHTRGLFLACQALN